MRIVYTNLQEDDFGVKRSVKHLHVDFSRRSPDRAAVLTEEKLHHDGGSSRKSPHNVLSAERWRAGHDTRLTDSETNESPTQGNVGDSGPISELRLFQETDPIRRLFIRRFTEAQLLTTGRIETGKTINVFA